MIQEKYFNKERYNLGHDTIACLNAVTDAMVGNRLTYKALKAVI